MNLAIDERTKHRLTGLVVIMAVAIIFVPAMLKKSNQRLEENIHVSVQLPPKPSTPKVAVTEEKAVFDTVKVAQVALPVPTEPTPASQIARIEKLTSKPTVKPIAAMTPTPASKQSQKPMIKKAVMTKPTTRPVEKQTSPVFVKAPEAIPFNPKPVLAQQDKASTEAFAVQLAAFNVEQNAEKLVARLREQGYKARYYTITSDKGDASYKVTVGQLDDRADARILKNKLIESTKLEGFIVKREVG
ncbi:MAG: SPOR domain-containing protein [Legionellaceae bacterium]|nr:SPOR domain-containing protein [Legionellaceae bacterium]